MATQETVIRYIEFRRVGKGNSWYLTPAMERTPTRIDELNASIAMDLEAKGEMNAAAYWRDVSNRCIVPVEIKVPQGVEVLA